MINDKNYENFKESLLKEMVEYYGENYNVSIQTVVKQGRELDALTILPVDGKISPNMYLEKPYEDFCNGKSMELISQKIQEEYSEAMEYVKNHSNYNFDDYNDFEKIKNKIYPNLINTENNQAEFVSFCHKKFMDLSVIYRVQVETGESNYSFKIHNEMLKRWGIDLDTLHTTALSNLMDRKGLITPEFMKLSPDMVILTNSIGFYGATNLLNEDALNFLADDLGGDLFIIPSSIHEVIAIPYDENADIDYLNSTVKSVNISNCEPQDVLADHIYQFKDRTLEIAKPKMPEISKADEGRKLALAEELTKSSQRKDTYI